MIQIQLETGMLEGEGIITSQKHLSDLTGVFENEDERSRMDQSLPVYRVQAYMPVDNGIPGGLFFGNSTIMPGKVDKEYFMTRGHFHQKKNTAEYYWCIKGKGALILMDENRETRMEEMQPGSLHYIPGNVAHRVANTGHEELVFNACWPSDAGHDYESIEAEGFSARLVEENGKPVLKRI